MLCRKFISTFTSSCEALLRMKLRDDFSFPQRICFREDGDLFISFP